MEGVGEEGYSLAINVSFIALFPIAADHTGVVVDFEAGQIRCLKDVLAIGTLVAAAPVSCYLLEVLVGERLLFVFYATKQILVRYLVCLVVCFFARHALSLHGIACYL